MTNSQIIAFDGLLADSLPARAEAIAQSLNAEHIDANAVAIAEQLPGKSLAEVVRTIAPGLDETSIDLIALRAQSILSQRLAQGIDLKPGARDWILRQQAAGARLILRADSVRRDVETVLQLTGLSDSFALVRCSDDLPRVFGASTLESSYSAIRDRLARIGVNTEHRAVETSIEATSIASRFVSQTVHSSLLE